MERDATLPFVWCYGWRMWGKARILAGCLAALLALAGATSAAAAPPPAAGLDPGFGQGGRAFVPFPGPQTPWSTPGLATAVGADGSLLLGVGDTVERLDANGQLDRAFGQDGAVKVIAPSGDSSKSQRSRSTPKDASSWPGPRSTNRKSALSRRSTGSKDMN